jgi:streptogramin lyase
MLSGVPHRLILIFVCAVAVGAVAAATAGAAGPVLYELPAATHAGSMAVASDGTVWFRLSRGNRWEGAAGAALGRIEADGAFAEVPVAGLSEVGAPAVGAGGEVWVSYGVPGKGKKWKGGIARLSSTGAVERRYPLSTAAGSAELVAAGRDAVWFVRGLNEYRNGVERLDPETGAVRRFQVAEECFATNLTAAGKNAFFGETCRPSNAKATSRFVRIGPTGRVTRWPLRSGSYLNSIAVGKGGTLWFGATLNGVSSLVGRVSRAGKVSTYRVRDAWLYSIALGPGGRVWFPSSFGGAIPRGLASIDGSGELGETICADPTCELKATALATAPDGSLWYALATPHSIGGGGLTQIMEGEEIGNEAGFVAHLTP